MQDPLTGPGATATALYAKHLQQAMVAHGNGALNAGAGLLIDT